MTMCFFVSSDHLDHVEVGAAGLLLYRDALRKPVEVCGDSGDRGPEVAIHDHLALPRRQRAASDLRRTRRSGSRPGRRSGSGPASS